MKNSIFTVIFFFFLSTSGFSQIEGSLENPIDTKFTELIESSNTFKGYKVVDYENLLQLQEETSAFIENLEKEMVSYQESIQEQKEATAALKTNLKEVQAQLEKVSAEKDALTFLGMPFDKQTYKLLMWSIVAGLVAALVLFIIKYKKSHVYTREARKNLAETEKELEEFRVKSLEKEQRLGRLLQDERNKLMKIAK